MEDVKDILVLDINSGHHYCPTAAVQGYINVLGTAFALEAVIHYLINLSEMSNIWLSYI